ncbi:MAG: ring-opening amidohydrolase [Pseudomonadota bacterium]
MLDEKVQFGPAMAAGAAITRNLAPHEIGTFAHIECVAETVDKIVRSTGIAAKEDVHFVQIKYPLLTKNRVTAATVNGGEKPGHDGGAKTSHSDLRADVGRGRALWRVRAP